MPFEVVTTTTVKWEPVNGDTDDSRFLIIREDGNLTPLIGTADWTDNYPSYRLCLVQECWPDNVMNAARQLMRMRGLGEEELDRVRAIILGELKVGVPSIRIGLTTSRYYHGIIDEHATVLEGCVTGFSVID